jgi:hypothetical protein
MKHTLRCHGFGGARNVAPPVPRNPKNADRDAAGQNRASPKGLRPESALALSLGLPIQRVLAAPRFAPLPILARNARAFHYVTGSKIHVVCPSIWTGLPASVAALVGS